jgi:hypothetical protein
LTQVTVHDRTRARWRIGKSLLYWQDAAAAVSVRFLLTMFITVTGALMKARESFVVERF